MVWSPPSPDGIAMCQDGGAESHGATTTGEVKFRKKLTRDQVRAFMAAQPAALVMFEACGSASYWAGEMEALGHEVRLIAPQYVRPFVKRRKNDGEADRGRSAAA